MNYIIRTLIALLLTAATVQIACALPASRLKLSESGKTDYKILIAPNASSPEKNAASELAFYLNRITGAQFEIIDSGISKSQRVIAIGPGAAKSVAPKLSLDRSKLGDDGIIIKTIKSNLVLSGAENSKRGTLYAVYTFLEDICGVRWWTESSSYIPYKPDLTINEQDTTYIPVFRYREALYKVLTGGLYPNDPTRTLNTAKFLARSKYNGHFNAVPSEWGGSYYIIGWCHTFYAFMPPATNFDQHPEWFSEINGKRVGHQAQLCCTNDEMIAELAKSVLATIAQRPDAGIVSVSQNDWGGNCQCAKCSALDKAEGSPSASLLYCINKVAEEVEKKYPDFLVETLAYAYTRKPPKTIRPRKNVLMRLAVIERSGAQPIDSTLNSKLMEDLQVWKSAAPNLFIWDYTADMWGAFTPHPNLSVFAPDARTYAASNVVGVFNEGNHYSGDARGDFDELKTYVMSHVLWNPNVNVNKIISEFLNGYYGEAGPALLKYLKLIDSKSRNVWIASCGGDGDASWMNLDTMNTATKLFNEAEQAVGSNAVLLNRVRRARLQLDHQWLRRYNTYVQAAKKQNKAFYGPEDITAATDAFLSRVEKYEGKDIQAEGALNLEQYAAKMKMRANDIKQPATLPAQFSNIGIENILDVQEQDMTLAFGADIAPDTKASNGFAAKIDPAVLSWSVQFKGIGGLLEAGKWHVYANIRCEKIKDSGIALSGGIYDGVTAKNLVGLSVYIEDNSAVNQVDPNIEQIKTVTSTKGAGDGEYQLYDMGVHDLAGQNYVWFGTTGGVSPENVKAIYIDRIIFVKEP